MGKRRPHDRNRSGSRGPERPPRRPAVGLGFPLPKTTARAADQATRQSRFIVSNFGLLFHRYLRYPHSPLLEPSHLSDQGWPRFCAKLLADAKKQERCLGKTIWQQVTKVHSKVEAIARKDEVDRQCKRDIQDVVRELNKVLESGGAFRREDYQSLALDKEATELLDRGEANLTERERQILDRLLLEAAYPNEIARSHPPRQSDWSFSGEAKSESWHEQVGAMGERVLKNEGLSQMWQAFRARQKETLNALASQGFVPKEVPATVAWRLAIGLGTPSVRDTGMALDPIYGVPYIPGSAVKGATRAHRLSCIAERYGVPYLGPVEKEMWKEATNASPTPLAKLEAALLAEKEPERQRPLVALMDDLQQKVPEVFGDEYAHLSGEPIVDEDFAPMAAAFRQVFGTTAAEGCVTFFDAYPAELQAGGKSILELDIINTHYQKYYTGEPPEPPADWHDPVPVYFLTVREGTRFELALAASGRRLGTDERGALADTAECWVRKALSSFGAGAKTRSGYGELTVSVAIP